MCVCESYHNGVRSLPSSGGASVEELAEVFSRRASQQSDVCHWTCSEFRHDSHRFPGLLPFLSTTHQSGGLLA